MNPLIKPLGSTDIMSGNEEKTLTESPEQGIETWDEPQGAEGGHYNDEKSSNSNTQHRVVVTCWQCENAMKPQRIKRHFSPYPTRREKVFHIDKNGKVNMGFLSNIDEFEGEIIAPLPREQYPLNLYSADLVWPCHRDMTNADYMKCISAQIDEAHMFMYQVLLRVTALQTNYMRYWRFITLG